MKRMALAFSVFAAFAAGAADVADAAERVSHGAVDVLVYTRWDWVKNEKTGVVAKGGTYGPKNSRPYHHASTEQGAEEVRRYFTANGLKCLVTDDPAFFTSDAMNTLRLVFLCNCNHELFDTDAQRAASSRWSCHSILPQSFGLWPRALQNIRTFPNVLHHSRTCPPIFGHPYLSFARDDSATSFQSRISKDLIPSSSGWLR